MATDRSQLQPTTRWYSVLGFQFTRRQLFWGVAFCLFGVIVFCGVIATIYIPPRWIGRSIRWVGGHVRYQSEPYPSGRMASRFYFRPTNFGLTATDEHIEHVQLQTSSVDDTWLHHLKSLENLKHLDVDDRQLGPGLQDLAELPQLSEVTLWRPCSGNMGELKRLPNVFSVSIVAPCSGIDLSSLSSVSKLQSFHFQSDKISEQQLQQISRLPRLMTIYLSRTKIEGDATGIAHLAQLTNLRTLYLYQVTDEMAVELAKIPSLTTLVFEDPKLTMRGVDSLAQLTSLREVQLNNISSTIDTKDMQKRLPSIRFGFNYPR